MALPALLFVLLVTSTPSAFAQKLNYARRLATAKSARQVREMQTRFELLQIASRACRLQMASQSAPTACYESLELESKWGMHTRPEERQMRERLDAFCAEAAEKFLIPRRVPWPVSRKCRADILAANEVLKYREKRPAWSEN